MRTFPLIITMFLSLCFPVFGQVLDLPPEVKAEPGELTRVDAKTDCKELAWKSNLGVIPIYTPGSVLATSVAFATMKEGTYFIVASGVTKDNHPIVAVSIIHVGQPTPPPPPPPPPGPQSELGKALQKAYQASTESDKSAKLKILIQCWEAMANEVKTANVTTGTFLQKSHETASKLLGGETVLDPVRTAIADYVDTNFGSQDIQLTDELRTKAAKVFQDVANGLKEVTVTRQRSPVPLRKQTRREPRREPMDYPVSPRSSIGYAERLQKEKEDMEKAKLFLALILLSELSKQQQAQQTKQVYYTQPAFAYYR